MGEAGLFLLSWGSWGANSPLPAPASSTQWQPATHPAPSQVQQPQMSCWLVHTARLSAAEKEGVSLWLWGEVGETSGFLPVPAQQLFCAFVAIKWISHTTLYTSPRRAAYQCETHSFHVCIGSYSDSIINLDRKGDFLFRPHLSFWEEKEIASYVSKKGPCWLGEPQLQHTVVTLWNTFPLNPLPSAVSSVFSYLAHRQESSAQRRTAQGTM